MSNDLVLREAGLRQITCGSANYAYMGMWHDALLIPLFKSCIVVIQVAGPWRSLLRTQTEAYLKKWT